MDAARLGGDLRLLRRRLGWSQRRLAIEARVSRWAVGAAESGRGGRLPIDDLVAMVNSVGGYLSVRVLFRGEGLDRLRDRGHAELVEAMVTRLQADGWTVATEVSFNVFGERGSIDLLAFHSATGTLLVVEVKTVVPDVGGSLETLDRKVRLAPDIARERGWVAREVARLLVLPETSSARRRIVDHRATFATAFPARTVEVNRWLRSPSGALSGMLFLPKARATGHRRVKQRAPASAQRRPRTRSC